jgi:nitrate/nitrite transport system permease protein
MTALKTEAAAKVVAATLVPVVTMTPRHVPASGRFIRMAKHAAVRVAPPLIVIALLMLIWELVCRRTGSTLPPPSRVFNETRELIFDPFFDHGGIDKGLFWHLVSNRRSGLATANACCMCIAQEMCESQNLGAVVSASSLVQVAIVVRFS